MSFDTNHDELEKVQSQFNKKFHYSCSSSEKWDLCDIARPHEPYNSEEFRLMKEHLNEVKSKLNELSIEIWSEHTRNMNPAGEVVWRVRNETKGEFVTQVFKYQDP